MDPAPPWQADPEWLPADPWSENWTARTAAWLATKIGSVPEWRVGKLLKPFTLHHTEARVRDALLDSIAAAKARGQPWRLDWFAENAVRWIENAELPLDSPAGLTARGLAITGGER